MRMRNIKKGQLLKATAHPVDKYGKPKLTYCIWVVTKDFDYDTIAAKKVYAYPPERAEMWGNRVTITLERFKELEVLGFVEDFPEYSL